jgi:hypothetical protein
MCDKSDASKDWTWGDEHLSAQKTAFVTKVMQASF